MAKATTNIWFDTETGAMSIRGQNGAYMSWSGASFTIAGEKAYLVTASHISETLDKMLAITKLLQYRKE